MATSARERLTRVALGLVLLAGVVAVAFGAGYRASNALLDGASAYVQKDHTVVRVNAESRDSDAAVAKKLAAHTERLEVVQVAPGVVYVVNNATGAVWRLPTDTLNPEPVRGGDQRPVNPPQMLAGGGRAYLFDKKHGTLTLLEDPSGRGRQEIRLPQPPTQVVVDGSGMAWALSQQVGELYGVGGGSVVARRHVADAWEPALLTLARDRPVVYRPVRGMATMYDRSSQVRAIELPREGTWGGVDVSAPGADSPVLVITSEASGLLTVADFGDGGARRTRLAAPAAHRFGPSVVSHGRIYVPDYKDGRVVVFGLSTLRLERSVDAPGKTYFELFQRDDRVWVNDPYDKATLSFDRNGRPVTIDKTHGYVGETGEPSAPGIQRPEPRPPLHHPVEPAPPRPPLVHPSTAAPSAPSAPSSPSVVATTRVPNLAGKTVAEAHQALEAAHLRWRDDTNVVVRSGADVGRVVRQAPRGGAHVPNGGVVIIWYPDPGQGSPVEVPNLSGLSADQACQTLQSITLGCAGTAVPHPTATGVHSQNPGAGVRVSSGTSVSYLFQPVAPVPLNRYKADRVNSRYLSLGGGPTGDGVWKQQPPTASVYRPEAIGQPGLTGLVAVYQAGCGNCDVQTIYYYANADGRTPAQPSGAWASLSGAEFACFHRTSAPQGTVPLMRMSRGDGQHRRWEFAPMPGPEYTAHHANGFVDDKDLCYVWPR